MYQEKLTIQQNKEDTKYINLKRYTLKGLNMYVSTDYSLGIVSNFSEVT